jgi:hypothetical protein
MSLDELNTARIAKCAIENGIYRTREIQNLYFILIYFKVDYL